MHEQRDSSLPDLSLITDHDVFCFKPSHEDLPGGLPADESVAERPAVVIPFRPRPDAVSSTAAEGRR